MQQSFITNNGALNDRWREAFPGAVAISAPEEVQGNLKGVLWVDYDSWGKSIADEVLQQTLTHSLPVVVLSSTPSEKEAFRVLGAGCRGYCHRLAAPRQMRELSDVVAHGGLWLTPELMQRLVSLSVRVSQTDEAADSLEKLTEREGTVAEQVATGATNPEIARLLGISERTVKAHLSSIFEKLAVRDRVHLALLVSGKLSSENVN